MSMFLQYIKMLYALAMKVLKNQETIKGIRAKLPPPNETAQLNPYLIEILIAEQVVGEHSLDKYRPKREVKYVLENQKKICKLYDKCKGDAFWRQSRILSLLFS